MNKIVYGSLSVLTAVCTVFVAARAEVFSENRTDASTNEIVGSAETDDFLATPNALEELGSPLEGSPRLSLDTGILDAETKALGSSSLSKAVPSEQGAVKASPKAAASIKGASSAIALTEKTASPSFSQTANVPTGPSSSQIVVSQPSSIGSNGLIGSAAPSAPASIASNSLVTAQSAPETVPAPTGGSTLPSPGFSPNSGTALEADDSNMELDAEATTGVDAGTTLPSSGVEIGQPAPAGDDPFGAPSTPGTGTIDAGEVEIEEPASGIESSEEELEPDAESIDGTTGADDTVDGLDTEADSGLSEDPSAPSGITPSVPGGTETPGLQEVPATTPGLSEPAGDIEAPADAGTDFETESEMAPDAGTGFETETDIAPDAGTGFETETDIAPDAGTEFETESDIAPDAGTEFETESDIAPGAGTDFETESEMAPDAGTGFETEPSMEPEVEVESETDFGTPETAPVTPGGTSAPATPIPPGTPLPSTPLPQSPAEDSLEEPSDPFAPAESEPLSPIEEDVVPDDLPTSGSESFGTGDRLIGEGFSPFQLSYLAVGGGLEGIPGGEILLSAYEAGDISAADIVDAGALTNRLGTDADDQDDYTAGVDRFLALLSRDAD